MEQHHKHYFTMAQLGARVGVSRDSVKKYRLPAHDASYTLGGKVQRLWLASTIDSWNAARPSRVRAAAKLKEVSE